MPKIWRLSAISFIIVSLILPPSPPTIAISQNCDDVQFIFARGSGETLGDRSDRAWESSIRTVLAGSKLKYSFYELGSARQGNFQYPAVAVGGSSQGYLNLIGAYISSGASYEFGASVMQGRGELATYLTKMQSVCPQTKFVLGGYSQGAMVISSSLPHLPAEMIAYAATFGDPKLYLPEGNSKWFGFQIKVPAACYGRELSNYRAYVPNCFTYQGILGGQRPYQEADYRDKLGAWCNDNDIMCSSGSRLDDHLKYVSKGLYLRAAEVIARKVSVLYPQQTWTIPIRQGTGNLHELAILYNGTGAADRLAEVKQKILALGTKVLQAGGDVVFRRQFDYGNQYGSSSGYNATTKCYSNSATSQFCAQQPTFDLTEFAADAEKLTGTNDGAWATGVFSSAYQLMQTQNWQQGATKSLVIFSQGDPYRNTKLTPEKLAELSLSIDPVNIYVVTDAADAAAYAPLAELTQGGKFMVTDNLEAVVDQITGRPVAELALAEYQGTTNEPFYFDASASAVASNTEHLHYDWDLDFDHDFEVLDGDSAVTQVYDSPGEGFVQVRVRDDYGHQSTMSAYVKVAASTPQPATISATSTPLANQQAQIEFQTDAERVLVIVNDAILGFVDSSTQTNFVLGDLTTEGTNVTLTAYSAGGQRGQSVQVQATSLSEEPNQPAQPTVTPDPVAPVTSSKPATALDSDQSPVLPAVPKAPSTGVRRRTQSSAM